MECLRLLGQNLLTKFSIATLCLVLFFFNASFSLDPPNLKNESKAHILPPCQACKTIASSFMKGMSRTARGNFEGGDADWEEKKLRSYANSEVRLVEIQEKLCSEVSRGQDQCHNLAEAHESLLEEWFFKLQKVYPELSDWLCVNQLKVCCPDHTYGPECKPCPSSTPDTECSTNGKCKGSGTRKGNGKCVCDKGYSGEVCMQCSNGFFESYKDETKVLCTPCHPACKDVCTQAGPKGCITCTEGWSMDTEHGCSDVDECLLNTHRCKENSFCINSPGSFKCIDCDKACMGCTADGPDNCLECANGYTMKDGICSDKEESENNQKAEL